MRSTHCWFQLLHIQHCNVESWERGASFATKSMGDLWRGAPFIPYHFSQWQNLSWAKHVGWVWKSELRQSWGHLTHCSQRKPDYYLTPFIYWVPPQKALSFPYTECLYFVFKMYWKEGRDIYNTVIINASVSRWYRPQWNLKILVSF